MDSRIYRFKNLDSAFYPYLEEVLNRVPVDIKERVLNDLGLEMIGSSALLFASGWFVPLSTEKKSIIYLQHLLDVRPHNDIIQTIAHEIAHYIIRRGDTGLYEKEAEELIVKWGFTKESESVKYNRPILERKGYRVGYEWAKLQEEWKLENLEEYYEEWVKEEWVGNRRDELWYEIDPGSVIDVMRESVEKDLSGLGQEIRYDNSFERGIVWGVMDYIGKERIKRRELQTGLIDKEQSELIDLLEKISNDIDRLYSLESFLKDYSLLASKLGIPSLSDAIDTLLERVRSDAKKE
jgi:hypothetical protein